MNKKEILSSQLIELSQRVYDCISEISGDDFKEGSVNKITKTCSSFEKDFINPNHLSKLKNISEICKKALEQYRFYLTNLNLRYTMISTNKPVLEEMLNDFDLSLKKLGDKTSAFDYVMQEQIKETIVNERGV
tara:strand:- start:336 stop:734 length:399 start_codon:yes stop_codon:yes gene_type:complete